MKRFLSAFLCFLILSTFAGCDAIGYPSETDMEYMVAALGFDKSKNGVKALVEIIVVNSDNMADNTEKSVLSAEGETVQTAIYNLRASLSKPLMLNHCGLLVLDSKLYSEQIREIWDYCFNEKNITQAIETVCTDSAEKLMNLKPSSAVAMGYEISSALKQNSEYTGIKYRNRYYQIENLRQRKSSSYAIPFLKVIEQKHKIDGLQIYYKDKAFKSINEQEAPLFSMLNNSFKKGTVSLDKRCFDIILKAVDYNFLYKDNKLSVKLTLNLNGEEESINAVRNNMKSIDLYKNDVYGIADEIYRRDIKLFNKIKDDYGDIFAAADIKISVRRVNNG